jgi:hypothetical protein
MARAPNTRYRLTLGTGRVAMGDARLKEYIKIDRRDEGSCYVIYCQRCETITYCVNARGYMFYKEATRLARKHRCV